MMMMMMRGLFFFQFDSPKNSTENCLVRDGNNADGFAAQERKEDHHKKRVSMLSLSVVRLFFFFQYECSTSVSEERATVCE